MYIYIYIYTHTYTHYMLGDVWRSGGLESARVACASVNSSEAPQVRIPSAVEFSTHSQGAQDSEPGPQGTGLSILRILRMGVGCAWRSPSYRKHLNMILRVCAPCMRCDGGSLVLRAGRIAEGRSE